MPRRNVVALEVVTLKECRALFAPSRNGMSGRSEGVVGEITGNGRASLVSDAHHEIFVDERARNQRIARRAKRR
jgi:hypothetical protein